MTTCLDCMGYQRCLDLGILLESDTVEYECEGFAPTKKIEEE